MFCLFRENQLGVEGWAAVSDALKRVMSLTSLNGCGQYAAIRAGGLAELELKQEWELGVWAARFLERSGATLTALDVRWRGGGARKVGGEETKFDNFEERKFDKFFVFVGQAIEKETRTVCGGQSVLRRRERQSSRQTERRTELWTMS